MLPFKIIMSISTLVLVGALIVGFAMTEKASQAAVQPAGMVLVQGGTFEMGREGSYADEAPLHEVNLDAFWLDRHEVTNRQFEQFVAATNHVTRAEKDGSCWCFVKGTSEFTSIAGADWRHPEGPESSIADRWDHPVVCVSWNDAHAYAEWAGMRLPTEAEWEYAARAGARKHLAAQTYPVSAEGIETIQANVWEGVWPEQNRLEDGHYYTAAIGQFEPNAWKLHDMIGNVWEWTADWYAADYYVTTPKDNPLGAALGEKKVARGGSWFCSPNYCGAYSTHYRGASPPGHSFNNVGFRCARDTETS